MQLTGQPEAASGNAATEALNVKSIQSCGFLMQKQSWKGLKRIIKSGRNCLTASVTTEEFSKIYITQTLADSCALADMECI